MSGYETQLFLNRTGDHEFGAAQRAILNQAAFSAAQTEISSWPGYGPTPLFELPARGQAADVGTLWCKHEGYRFGIGSFKSTGPTYAMIGVLKAEVQKRAGVELSTQDLINGTYAAITADLVVSAATSGNHGRALAWGAQTFGCRAVLYMNEGVSAGRAQAIESYGGEVVRVPGAYQNVAVRLYEDAETHGHLVIGDPGMARYPHVSRDVMQGYAMVVDELMAQADPRPPTHVFVPGGGGILAGATCGHLWERFGPNRPRVVVVEPMASCCLYESARVGRAVQVGEASSVMDGLVVEEPATEAFGIIRASAFAFLTIPDQDAVDAMRQAAAPEGDDPQLVIGDTGSAAWAGFLAASTDPRRREALELDDSSRVAIIVSEGATDPKVYQSITGLTPEQIPVPQEILTRQVR